jgi:MATE family multidrug resistance protein
LIDSNVLQLASVRISNTLGMSHPRAAKYSFLVTISQTLVLGIIFMTIIVLSKQEFPMIFTKSDDMIHAASELAYLLGITMVLNSVSQTISGDLHFSATILIH